jgi:GT2 family glycosyltransferase
VVIPTLQRAPQLAGLVAALEADPLVAEILVVNNAPQPLPLGSSRTRVLHRPENIFVNPAWNLGVQCTTAPLLAIANDDIVLPAGLLAAVTRRLARGAGIVGAHPSCFGGPPRRPRIGRRTS